MFRIWDRPRAAAFAAHVRFD